MQAGSHARDRARRGRFARVRYSCSPGGFTILELMVVVIIISAVALAAVPAMLPDRPADDEVAALIAQARRSALRQAGPITLAVDAVGGWRMDAPHGRARTGNLAARPSAAFTLEVSALGACRLRVPATAASSATVTSSGSAFMSRASLQSISATPFSADACRFESR
jgi:prepilin-type N-terminal cleavage/methylation domain-containing protein